MNTTVNKAIVAAVLGGLAAALAFAIPVVDDGLVASEVLGVVLAFLTGSGVTGGVTWAVPNKATSDPTTSTPGPFPGEVDVDNPDDGIVRIQARRAGDQPEGRA